MTIDVSDAQPQVEFGAVIPDGSFVHLKGKLRPGGHTLENSEAVDNLLFYASKTQGSDAVMLDWEFTVLAGPHKSRKLWRMMVVSGGEVDEKGVSKGWKITKSTLMAMIQSAFNIRSDDKSPQAVASYKFPGFSALDGIEFFARVGIELGNERPQGGNFPDKNTLAHVVIPDEPEWAEMKAGKVPEPRPSGARSAGVGGLRVSGGQAGQGTAPATTPAWQRPVTAAASGNGAATPAAAAPAPTSAVPAASAGPAWLRQG